MQVLVCLAEHAGDVIGKDRIIQAVWADTFVTDDVLTRAISELRNAFDDDPREPRVIQTIPKGGYRLIALVEGIAQHAGAVGELPPQRRWLMAAGAAAIAASLAAGLFLNITSLRDRLGAFVGARHGGPLPKVESIAVLPLENLSRDPEQEYFADGMTDELITNLGKISALRVISRTSVMRYKGTKKPLPEIARELNVDVVLEGTVQRSSNRVRVTANLLHAPTDRHLWAETYDRDVGEILVLQADVARAIANEIQLKLTPQEQARLASAHPISPEAYEFYVKGRFHGDQRTDEDVEKCIEYFQKAIQKDPTYTPAYAALSESYSVASSRGLHPVLEGRLKAEAMARKALELDDTLGEAHAALGGFRGDLWDWEGALREFRRAIELDPNSVNAYLWSAETLSILRRHEEALRQAERAMKLDPVSLVANRKYGHFLNHARRYDEAIAQFRKTLELYPYDPMTYYGLRDSYEAKEMYVDGATALLRAIELEGASPEELASYRKAYREEGIKGLWRRRLEVLKRKGSRPWAIACYYVQLGEKDQAFESLEKNLEVSAVSWLPVEPCFNSLRSDQRYRDLLRRMNLPQ